MPAALSLDCACQAEATVQLQPLQPAPLSLAVTADFSDAAAGCYSCVLPPLQVSFRDLFAEVPLPPAWGCGERGAQAAVARWRLFGELWAHIGHLQQRAAAAPSLHAALDMVSAPPLHAALDMVSAPPPKTHTAKQEPNKHPILF